MEAGATGLGAQHLPPVVADSWHPDGEALPLSVNFPAGQVVRLSHLCLIGVSQTFLIKYTELLGSPFGNGPRGTTSQLEMATRL